MVRGDLEPEEQFPMGSSPREWGAGDGRVAGAGVGGIIPT